MPSDWTCPDDPSLLWQNDFCLSPLSKDLKGDLNLIDFKPHVCSTPTCSTLTTMHSLRMGVSLHLPCDDPTWGKHFDGVLGVERLITIFDQDGLHRGLHAGDFQWQGNGLQVFGRMSGMTNVGTHRAPVFSPACQKCKDTGVMEGRLCGSVVDVQYPELQDSQVTGVYRIRFTASAGGSGSSVSATFEGVVLRPCLK